MNPSPVSSRTPRTCRSSRLLAPVVVLVAGLALLIGLSSPASARPAPDPAKNLKAITAMESKMSTLRVGPDGKPLVAKAAVGAAPTGAPGSSDLMGTPADKTVLRSDQVLREINTSGEAAGNGTTAAGYSLNAGMTSPASTPAEAPLAARSTIDHRYPSVHGHFLDATHEGVLDFKEGLAGNDGLFSLTSPDQSIASKRTVAPTGSDPQVGTTYAVIQGNTAMTNTGVAESTGLGVQARSVAMLAGTPSESQLWTMVDSGHGDGTFSLVNRSDGLCLAVAGTKVTIDSCEDDATRHWNIKDNGNTTNFLFPAGGTTDTAVGADGGTSVPSTLSTVPGHEQTWSFQAITETVASAPSWSVDRANGFKTGNVAAPYDMAAGDLDGAVTQDPVSDSLTFHDEAVVLYTDSNDNWAMRVIDYNANTSRLLVTAPSSSLSFGKTGATVNGIWNPGDLIADVGDFNGDGKNEIATAYQGDDGNFDWTFWQYVANTDGTRSLNMLSSAIGAAGSQPFQSTANITLQQGYADSAVGDFDGNGQDDIALAFANDVANVGRQVNLGVWTVNADLSTRSVEINTPAMPDGNLSPSMASDAGRTSSGIQLAAGNFMSDPDNGFGIQRSELAVAWSAYSVGEHVHNPDTGADMHPYTITPELNIYSVATSDCNAAGTTCVSTTTPTNGSNNPTAMFPTQTSQIATRDFGDGYDIPPISLAVGTFGGTDTKTDPPVDGLLASAWMETNPYGGGPDSNSYYTRESIIVPWASGDDTFTKWTINDSQESRGPNWVLSHYTGYDGAGLSTVLGAPTILNIEQNMKENVVAAEPPTQVDWLNGDWSNVSGTSDFYLQTKTTTGKAFTSSTSNENSYQNGVNQSTEAKVSWSATPAILPEEKGFIDVQQKFNKTWSGLTQNSSNASSTWSTEAAAQTNQDDAFSYSADDTELYRYPIIGKPGVVIGANACTSGCRATYDVYIPKGSVHFDNVAGKSTSIFQPAWENMNALSYPAISSGASNPVPMPDLGAYTYTDQNGNVQAVIKPIYNQVNSIGANSGTVTLDFSSSAGTGTTTTHARSWTVGADVTVSGTVGVGAFELAGADADLTLTASAGFDVTKSTNTTSTGTSNTSSAQEFLLNVPQGIDQGHGYDIGTAYYYSKDGAAKVVHGVDLTANQQSKVWWLQTYGQTPDPALNLPGRIELGYDGTTLTYDNPLWLTAPQRQLIRGFQVLQTDSDGSGLPTAGDPYTVNPNAGNKVTFQIPVHNYSLAPMKAGTTATWYAVPVDVNDISVTGPSIKLGTSTVPAIPAQGSTLVQAPTWAALANGNTQQQYRIVARLDEAGTAADMHPLAGDACPATSLEPNANNQGTPALYDITKQTQTADPLGCGQDNQGYGLVTVAPAPPSTGVGGERHATAADPARAQLSGGGLVDGNPDHLNLTENSDVPTIPVNQRITGLVHASAALQTNDHPIVAVYDGPVSDGKILGVTRMNGIDDKTGGHVSFTWTPTTPGLHELHQVLLGTKATGEDDEQIMRVNVAEPLDQYTVTAKTSAASIMTGKTFTISGKATPVADREGYRTVVLQKKVDDSNAWIKVDEQETSSTGAYSFDITAGEAGTYSYRALKLAAPGRTQTASPPVPVIVTASGQNSVTIAAQPTAVDTGKRVTFTGTVTPPRAQAKDRKVDLQVQSGSTWKTVAKGATTAAGAYTLTTRPARQGSFSYRVTQRAGGGLPATSSSPVMITVTRQYVVTAKINHAKVKVGKSAVVSGEVTPTESSASGRVVQLQVKSGSVWKTAATKLTAASGAYNFTVTPTKVGSYSYRVSKVAVGDRRTAYSATVKLSVIKAKQR